MIQYGDIKLEDTMEAMESLAYRVLQYQNPTYYEISEESMVRLLKEEGIDAYIGEEICG